ncbi:efflux RND transporter permease subunit [Sphingomonas prati]|uniref:Multidrug efflux pump subunit AcrB n=1 Tax=Sphingomonas prati TaxID=1843237 RepID=A0A7W9BS85_9SPHN|nr:efflux RND transporter permease subunit [Sphingomonas prati]MBB5729070.1 multidrug efflux pump subunit AcrB [Sphingomonas prati]GGE85339.1 multidrug transporter AcrB [Sphingomonas prati]
MTPASLTAFFVLRSRFTLMLCLLAVMLGVNAWMTITRSEDPQFPVPNMTVRVALPGATAEEIEQTVSRRIEEAAYGLDGISEVESTSTDGAASIAVRFDWSNDPDRKYDEVVRVTQSLRAALPAGVTRLEVFRNRTSETSIFEAALVSPVLPMRRFQKVADRLAEEIGRIPGIREARVWGAPRSELRVALDLRRLAALQLAPTAVSDALARAGVEGPIGAIHAGDRRMIVREGGAFTDLDAVRTVPVIARDGAVIRVGDVATVGWATGEPEHLTRFGGRRALLVTATAKEGVAIGPVTQAVKDRLAAYEKRLPGGVRLERAFFQEDNVRRRLNGLTRDFLIAFAVVAVTLLPLGLRAAGVVMLAIPLSLLVGLATLQAFGFGLNQLSIAGFVLSLGLLVDDSIVVTENIARHLRSGKDRTTAALDGTRQIFLAVAGCTACLMLAFLPLVALPEGSGAFIRPLPVAVIATIAASFVVALTVVPFAASRMLPATEPAEGNRLLRALDNGIRRFYRPLLNRALDRPWAALAALVMLCLLTIPLLDRIGSSLFPTADTPQFLIRVETPDGSALRATDRALRFVERRLAAEPTIAWHAANLGRGNPQLYYNQRQRDPNPTFGEVAAAFKEWRGAESEAVIARLRRDFGRYPGARIVVVLFAQGPSLEAPIEIRISGDDMTTLKVLAQATERALEATPGTRDIVNPLRSDRVDLALSIDHAKAAALGVEAGVARRTVRLALTGEEPARLRDPDGDDYPVRVRLAMLDRNELASLDSIQVPAAEGAAVPLAAIAQPSIQSGLARIGRYQQQRTVLLSAFVAPGYLTATVADAALRRVQASVPLPPGYAVSAGGEAEEQSRGEAGLISAVIAAVVGILAILVLEFGRFRLVGVVAGIVPLGLLGAVTALWLGGYSLSFTATIGVIALIGIEIKNSILLVDFTEQLRAGGMGMREAVEQAGQTRFLPVLLTSATAIGGLLPLAIEGSGLYAPMAIAIIGGLLSSTVLSRIATPVLYLLLVRGDGGKA